MSEHPERTIRAMLARVPAMRKEDNRGLLAARLRDRIGKQFSLPPGRRTIARITGELASFGETGWRALHDVINNNGEDYLRGDEVLDLLDCLAQLLTCDEVAVEEALEKAWGESRHRPKVFSDIYVRTVQDHGTEKTSVTTVTQCAMHILDVGGPIALCEFLERLARYNPELADDIQRLSHEVGVDLLHLPQERFDLVRRRIAAEPAMLSRRVLVRIGHPDDPFGMAVWSYLDGSCPSETAPYPPDGVLVDTFDAFETDEARRALTGLLRDRPDLLTGCAVLEVVLAWDRLNLEVERWMVPDPTGAESFAIGSRVPVVVRPMRDGQTRITGAHERWDVIHNPKASHLKRTLVVSPRTTTDTYRKERWLCAALDTEVTDRGPAIRAAHQAGIPVVLWSRSGADVHGVWNGIRLDELPHRVFKERTGGRTDLVLMFDNPYWVPQERELIWAAA